MEPGVRPKVGVGVIVVRGGKVLMHRRRNAHGEGRWSFSGGHLEFGESFENCAKREVAEESGLTVTNVRVVGVTNDVFGNDQKHYVTVFVVADHESGEPQLREPEYAEDWQWFTWDDLPRPLFLPIENLLQQGFRLLG